MSQDPWKHRSDNMKCKTCMWFVEKKSGLRLGFDLGRCRRHAPSMGGYPVVMVNDWCGDHRLDENKYAPEVGVPVCEKQEVTAKRMGDAVDRRCVGMGMFEDTPIQ